MPANYAPIPSPHNSLSNNNTELEAAFDESDDEEDTRTTSAEHTSAATQPLLPQSSSAPYDFERVDYDYPPPGSPPRQSSILFSADGNSNGLVPTSPIERPTPRSRQLPWYQRLLPNRYQQVPTDVESRAARVGGGTENDGVFANLASKPSRPRRIQVGDDVYLAPEEVQKEAPPSYATAQADAVPPYWETTIHAPSSGATEGELFVDSLPTGSLFAFLWAMLISVAFNFLGFVLTYLLHTTHAAKYGSRAGLGITLIQYGWALRARDAATGEWNQQVEWDGDVPSSVTEADAWLIQHSGNATSPDTASQYNSYVLGTTASSWLSFLLMTIGWFLLLTSVLGFWRVKRWERRI
ncbi:hypothetical protein SISSUDRAFT_998101, partial [Sistotremastrum suecicum HHB10207 ss-3]